MPSTKSKTDLGTKKDPNTLAIKTDDMKSRERLMAEVSLSSEVINAKTTKSFSKGACGEIDLTETVGVMRERTKQVNDGSLSELENTLTAQATTLNVIFNAMAQRAALNMGEHMSACETYLRMALKAQAQCRATIETLAEVKYPKAATFVRQQNVAYQQQVNNGENRSGNLSSSTHAHAHEKSTNQSNELLEVQHGERLDTRTEIKAGGNDQNMETVDKIDRRKDNNRKTCK
nr:hypothetical protein [uncultured Undibacterium sp.]